MPRVIWKGAISFGLVHVPVSLVSASSVSGIDFDWLDQRTMDPVGYKRINKRTGEELAGEHIVRGVKVADGRYVVLSDDEIKAAYPRTVQTIEIEGFVDPSQIPFTFLEKPFYLEPLPKGERVYALLREALKDAGVVGVARVVMHTKEHLAVLVPVGEALMLDTLRWAAEVKPPDGLKLPPQDRQAARLKEAELQMARQLIADMTYDWQADRYADRFTEAVQSLVDQRAAAGRVEEVEPLEASAPGSAASNVVDLTELLRQSLDKRGARPASADPGPRRRAATARKAPAPAPASAPAPTPAAASKPSSRRRA